MDGIIVVLIVVLIVIVNIVVPIIAVIPNKALIIATLPHFALINKHLKGHNLPGDKQQISHNSSLLKLILNQQLIRPFSQIP